MSTHMTHVDYTDADARVPGSDDGIGAWIPLSDDQRRGEACLDCGTCHHYPSRVVGRFDDGARAIVCTSCYIARLRDHIDFYRPQS